MLLAQVSSVTVSGQVKDKITKTALAYVNVILKKNKDSSFTAGTITGEDGRFSISGIKPGNYFVEFSYTGYKIKQQAFYIGNLSAYLDLALIDLETEPRALNEVIVVAKKMRFNPAWIRKVISVSGNIAQAGGSVLQVMQNLPGVTVQDGKVMIRGSDKVTILVDGKQTALTGFGNQTSLDNIPSICN